MQSVGPGGWSYIYINMARNLKSVEKETQTL